MSLTGERYETFEECKLRLESSIVLYQGSPVYITRVNPPGKEDGDEISRVFFRPLPLKAGGRETRKYLSSKFFDLKPFKMGYFDLLEKGASFFAARAPIRQYKQGLSENSLTTSKADYSSTAYATFDDAVKSVGFADMINNHYQEPSYSLLELRKSPEIGSKSLSREFAAAKDEELGLIYLVRKGVRCGFSVDNDLCFRVPDKFAFLKEELEENRIPIL